MEKNKEPGRHMGILCDPNYITGGLCQNNIYAISDPKCDMKKSSTALQDFSKI